MNIASVFDWFARESLRAAEHTEDPRQREILLKLAVLWEAAAQRSRDEASPQSTPPNTDERAHSEDDRAATSAEKSCSDFRPPFGVQGMISGRSPAFGLLTGSAQLGDNRTFKV